MGNIFSCCWRSAEGFGGGIPVVLNVYDLTTLNFYMWWCGLGIYHSGIEVHGLEYGFGAHDYPSSGVFEVEPKSCPGYIYKCSILLGYIDMAPSEFRSFIEHLAADYHGDTYHLISKNCNHFTDDVCSQLTGKPIPGWINRLARLGACCDCLLPQSLRQPAIKNLPDSHVGFSEDEATRSDDIDDDDDDEEKQLLSPAAMGVIIVKEVCE